MIISNLDRCLADLRKIMKERCQKAADGISTSREYIGDQGPIFAVYFVPGDLVQVIDQLLRRVAGEPETTTVKYPPAEAN